MKTKKFILLDVGAGSHSPSLAKRVFPDCIYHGIDIGNYDNSANDMSLMDRYFEMDVTKLDFDEIPDYYYDLIILSHIIEHLHNGDKVIEGLAKKLKPGGFIYIEYPGEKSTRFPKMRGSLNFYDDPTHVRLYSLQEIEQLLTTAGFVTISKGLRRYWPYILLTPIKIAYNVMKRGYIPGSIFWDILGFAEYVYAKKNS